MNLLVRDKQFYRDSLAIIIPVALQSLITIGVNMLDTIMVGSLGEIPLSAASLSNQFILIFFICCMGIGMGANVLTARYWGMQDLFSLKKAVTIMLRFVLVFASVFSIVTLVATGGILRIYTSEIPVIAEGVRYLKWLAVVYFFQGFSVTCTIVLRSVGQVKVPLIASIFSFFVNLIANYAFIFGKLGMPRMEIEGAALGTLIARIFEFLLVCGYFFMVDEKIHYRVRDLLCKTSDLIKEYFRISVPVLVSDALLGLGVSAVAMVLGRLGSGYVSAYAITSVTQQLTTVVLGGMSNAGAVLIGRTLGEGRIDQAKKQGYTFVFMAAVFGLFAGLVILVISGPVIGCYNITEETQAIAHSLMRAISIIVVFMSVSNLLTKGVLRGGGDTKFLMVADIIFLWAVSIPMGAVAAFIWHLPAFWIYFFLTIDHIIKAIWCTFRLYGGKWIKKVERSKLSEAYTEEAYG